MPIVHTHRLALATSAIFPDVHPDDVDLVASLHRLGIEPTVCVWNDPDVDWSRFDAVLIRATWDYFKHYTDFVRWLDRLPVPTINRQATLRWNSDKRYLQQLAGCGVDVIPMQIVGGAGVTDAMASMRGRQMVVKPTVSGGAWHTARGTVGDFAFAEAIAALPRELDYIVQPFVPEIVTDGEWSLLFFDGEYSHAVIKRAAPGDYRVQADYGGTAQRIEPDAALIDAAQRVLRATAKLGHADAAYARVDGVVVDGRFLLMELEMIEPLLHLQACPAAAERFAANLHRRLAG